MSAGQNHWADAKAPSLADFEEIAARAYAELPVPFRQLCDGVLLRVVDLPDDDVVEQMELESPFDILGLFTGIGMAEDGALPETGRMPNSVLLFRRPILDYWADHDETLGAIITHVLVHEMGHHFGLSDADIEAIEAAAEVRG